MTRARLLKVLTTMMEDHGMPAFTDGYPARDVLKLIEDAGWVNTREVGDGEH